MILSLMVYPLSLFVNVVDPPDVVTTTLNDEIELPADKFVEKP